MAEYHALAYSYGWSLESVRGMPRTLRQVFCLRALKQAEAESGRASSPLESADGLVSGGMPYREGDYLAGGAG